MTSYRTLNPHARAPLAAAGLLAAMAALAVPASGQSLSSEILDVLEDETDGYAGAYLKRVGGSVLCSVRADHSFEPASALKTLHHFHAMQQVAAGSASLSDPTLVFTNKIGSCPTGIGTTVIRDLEDVLKRMMEQSDNCDTMAIEMRFGTGAINQTALDLNMTGTAIRHRIGCGAPIPNALTLRDAGRLHEAVADGALGSFRDEFYDLMREPGLAFPEQGARDLADVVNEEAANLGVSWSERQWVRNGVKCAIKGGSYTHPGLFGANYVRTMVGWLELPFVENGRATTREYVIGVFVNNATNENEARNAIGRAASEMLRGEVRAALQSRKGVTFGSISTFSAPCLVRSYQPRHSAGGNPSIGQTVNFAVSGVRSGSTCVLWIGNQRRTTYFRGSNCARVTDQDSWLVGTSNIFGVCQHRWTIPNDASLVGTRLYTQYSTSAPRSWQTSVSNGVEILVGGQR